MARRVGAGNALYLLESAEPIDASRALATGLVQEVVPAGKALARSMELAERIAEFPQWSLRADRRSVLEGIGFPLEDGLAIEAGGGRAAEGDELRGGVKRFVEEREGGAAGTLHP
jgi:enoyl-CoA hydratase